mgnify:CR=1 FL=1
MMRCYGCGRTLLRAAATVTGAGFVAYAGPNCARRLGLLPRRAARVFAVRRRVKVDRAQMEIAA